ncbi:TATA element modulatory factor 1 TATA binding-domain-containing protein [Scheffersomyces coipomensis]|uniref:TATA element modulatory factor 1 TATA binding-domain-containing protein n=1 Tax=Scheffersomyces coipomensis TaxID=1788519 RepID=UPI00315CCAB5
MGKRRPKHESEGSELPETDSDANLILKTKVDETVDMENSNNIDIENTDLPVKDLKSSVEEDPIDKNITDSVLDKTEFNGSHEETEVQDTSSINIDIDNAANTEANTSSTSPTQELVEAAPVTKKRLTLQERLALAAKGKKSKSKPISSPNVDNSIVSSPNSLTPSTSNDRDTLDKQLDVSGTDQIINNETEIKDDVHQLKDQIEKLQASNSYLSNQVKSLSKQRTTVFDSNALSSFEKEKQELIAKVEAKDETIKQLLSEGEALSVKELKLNETIKKLKSSNADLETSLLAYSEKNEESSLALGEMEDFLKVHRFNSVSHLMEQHVKMSQKLEEVQSDLEKELGMKWEAKYREQQILYEEQLSSKKQSIKDFNELKIQHDMYKRQHELELDSKDALISDLKNEIANLKSNNNKEVARLEYKIELLRIENETSQNGQSDSNQKSKGDSQHQHDSERINQKSIDYDEFVTLSQTHHQLQQQFLASQENWKVIESNLLSKIDNLATTVDSLQRSKQKLTHELKRSTNTLTKKEEDYVNIQNTYKSALNDKEEIEFALQMKENELGDLHDKLEKLKDVYNNDRVNLTAKIKSLTDSLEKSAAPVTSDLSLGLSQRRFNGSGLNINIEQASKTPNFRSNSSQSIPDTAYGSNWQDIKFGESSTTPAIPKDFAFNNNSDTSLDESFDNINEDNYSIGSRYASQVLHSNNSNIVQGSISSTIPAGNGGGNIQLINKMSSNIRRLEIELNTLREENNSLIIEKEKTEQDILGGFKLHEELEALNTKIQTLETELDSKSKKEQTMLEVIGEKSEQVEELKADVQDLKELCKLQIQQLIEFQDAK